MPEENQFKIKAIDALIGDIGALTGSSFELWCYSLMKFIDPSVTWDNRGTTPVGAPIGYTVDSSGDHARVIAQYSSAKDYFSSSKPVDDLNSTVAKHPDVQKIWLLAGVQAAPTDRTDTDNAIAKWKVGNPNILVESRDSRQIATYIVDHLASDEMVESLEGKLPSLLRIAEENAFSHSLPDRGRYVSRRELEDLAKNQLSTSRYLILAGVSGVGKSDLAVQLAKGLDVESRFWLDARLVQRPEELSSLAAERRGFQHNISYLLKSRRCVLVLDDLHSLWPETVLREMVGPQSFLIITSQSGGCRADIVVVENANRAVARALLEINGLSLCPDEIFEELWSATKGHPLLLRLLGTLAEERDDWLAASTCCETIVSHGEDGNNEKVCCRVLKQHLPALRDELSFFLWCDSSVVDATLLSACVSPMAVRNLSKRHLLAAATPREIRLHDIVFRSAKIELGIDPNAINRYRDRLDSFIISECNKNTAVFDRVARRHNSLLSREMSRKKGSEVLYALARARVDFSVLESFGDIVAEAKRVGSAPSEIAVRSIMEAIEATYSLTSERQSRIHAKASLASIMEAFDILKATNLPQALCRDVRHHWAKMLTRLEEWDEAEREFRALLTEDPEMHATKLQLVRVLARNRKDDAIDLAMDLISTALVNVSPTVKIAAWAELARMNPDEVANRIIDIQETLKLAGDGDVAAAYSLVAQVGSSLAYSNPDAALALVGEMTERDPIFSSDHERLGWARTQVVAAKALKDKDENASIEGLLERARVIYQSTRQENLSEFLTNQYAENLLLLKEYKAAEAVLESFQGKERSAFWWYRYAQCALELGELKAALTRINEALIKLTKLDFKSAFLEVRFDIRSRMTDVKAVEDLREAISLARNAKYKEQLERKLLRRV